MQGTARTHLPSGVVDPYFVHELALELGMTVGEIGRRMSLHELAVLWPSFFHERAQRLKDSSK